MKILILAGGEGHRLWPFSNENCPKPFLRLTSSYSLLQQTVRRFLSYTSAENIFISTTQDLADRVRSEIESLEARLLLNILEEPEAKNTALAISFSVKKLIENNILSSGECLLVSPSDHVISPEANLFHLLPKAEKLAQAGSIVLFGIRPTKPETGYGYIQTDPTADPLVLRVRNFIEKPSYQIASQYLIEGGVLWNSGLFLVERDLFITQLHSYAPHLAEIFQVSWNQIPSWISPLPKESIDIVLLEKTDKSLVLSLDVVWSDIGSWDSVYDILDKDSDHNAILGKVVTLETKNCLIIGEQKLISTIGVEDLLIIETQKVIFIGKKGDAQKVRHLVALLQEDEKTCQV